jgi:hypothetical protein
LRSVKILLLEVFMANQSPEDALAELEEKCRKLSSYIEEVNFTCENVRQHNSLAIILIVKGLDILEARHGSDPLYSMMESLMGDRRIQRTRVVTEAELAQAERLRKFLP